MALDYPTGDPSGTTQSHVILPVPHGHMCTTCPPEGALALACGVHVTVPRNSHSACLLHQWVPTPPHSRWPSSFTFSRPCCNSATYASPPPAQTPAAAQLDLCVTACRYLSPASLHPVAAWPSVQCNGYSQPRHQRQLFSPDMKDCVSPAPAKCDIVPE